MYNENSPVLILIGGPTASGKTDFAIELAQFYKTEIISADSRQIYKELNIGTAKPSETQLKIVKHHFINHCSIFDNFNAGMFEEQALEILKQLFKKYKVVIAAGGTGLYINALCYGLDKLPPADKKLRTQLNIELETKGVDYLYCILKNLDPLGSKTVDNKNPHRIIRAIELIRQTGKTLAEIKTGKKAEREFKIVKIIMNTERNKLYENINKRVDLMIQEGLEKECKNLYEHKHLKALQTVGYSEMFEYFDGKYTLSQAIEKIKQHTRNYAKRQITWFKNDNDFISHLDFIKENFKV